MEPEGRAVMSSAMQARIRRLVNEKAKTSKMLKDDHSVEPLSEKEPEGARWTQYARCAEYIKRGLVWTNILSQVSKPPGLVGATLFGGAGPTRGKRTGKGTNLTSQRWDGWAGKGG